MRVSSIDYVNWLLPAADPKPTIFDSLPKTKNPIDSLLLEVQRINNVYLQFKYGNVSLFKNNTAVSELDYTKYIQYPNSKIKSLAMSIVSKTDSNDEKAWKLLRWVEDNIQYTDDLKNYRQDVLGTSYNDCEFEER